MEFCVVVPVKSETELILQALPAYYALQPSEVLICTDKPCEGNVRRAVNKVAELLHAREITRIIEVDRSPEWSFHQACVRREGFKKAKLDRILTGDIDLIVNRNVYKALELVGRDDVGLVSLTKLQYPHRLLDYWRLGTAMFLRRLAHTIADKTMGTTTFSGLYALWRPYWLDSEPEEEAKKFTNPKQILREKRTISAIPYFYAGEDTFLRDWISKKHKCIYLKNIGAIDLGASLENQPFVQYMTGAYFAQQKRSLVVSLGRSILRAQPHYLRGYMTGRSRARQKSVYADMQH